MGKSLKRKMLCPVCGKYYFSPLTKEEIEEGVRLEDDFCSVCGWRYDEKQLSDYDATTEYNEMSLNERKQWYQEQLETNPDYNYLDAHQPEPVPHLCPICGKHEFKSEYSYDICPYCGWEDDGITEETSDDCVGANGMTFTEYKSKYQELIMDDPNYKWANRVGKCISKK